MDGYTVTVRRLPGEIRSDSASGPAQGSKSRGRKVVVKAGRIALNILFVTMMAAVGIMVGPAALGYHRYVILTGSMTGTYDRGSIVYDRPVPVSTLKVGDPITYNPPTGFTSQQRVTHRIWWIGRAADGTLTYKTKGDANQHPDAWKFTLTQPTQDRVVFHIPELGYVFVLLSLRNFRMVLVGVPALIIGLVMLRGMWREGGEEARRRQLAELGWQKLSEAAVPAVLAPIEVPAEHRLPVRVSLGLRHAPIGAQRTVWRRVGADRSRMRDGMPLSIGRLASRRSGDTLGPVGRAPGHNRRRGDRAHRTSRPGARLQVRTLERAARAAEHTSSGNR